MLLVCFGGYGCSPYLADLFWIFLPDKVAHLIFHLEVVWFLGIKYPWRKCIDLPGRSVLDPVRWSGSFGQLNGLSCWISLLPSWEEMWRQSPQKFGIKLSLFKAKNPLTTRRVKLAVQALLMEISRLFLWHDPTWWCLSLLSNGFL